MFFQQITGRRQPMQSKFTNFLNLAYRNLSLLSKSMSTSSESTRPMYNRMVKAVCLYEASALEEFVMDTNWSSSQQPFLPANFKFLTSPNCMPNIRPCVITAIWKPTSSTSFTLHLARHYIESSLCQITSKARYVDDMTY